MLLFASAFAAATVLPLSSEILLLAQLHAGLNPMALWIFATTGNTLGAVVNWALGFWLSGHVDKTWFPVKRQELERAQAGFAKYGVWSLLFAWLPIVGDALTVVGGMMRTRLAVFVLLVAIGKGARYAVLIAGASWVSQAATT